MKKLIALWILLAIELFFLLKLDINDYEGFFLFFSIIGLFFLISNLFSFRSIGGGPLGGAPSASTQYNLLAGAAAESEFNTKEGKKRLGGFFDNTNWSYLFFFLINVMVYIIILI